MRLLLFCLLATCAAPATDLHTESPDTVAASGRVGSTTIAMDTALTVRGIFHTGFESSTFQPCDLLGEIWWLDSDSTFSARYNVLEARHVSTRTRGSRIFTEVTVTGILHRRPEGGYGHLGMYPAMIQVTETHDMTFLALNPDDAPACTR